MKMNADFDWALSYFGARDIPNTMKYQEDRLVRHKIGETSHPFCLPVTFTPFASTQACSARCIFCSESLCNKETSKLSASLRPKRGYFEGLTAALEELKGLPLGLSLSGLEATDNHEWLFELICTLEEYERKGGIFTDKVLYSNSSGLARNKGGLELICRLKKFGLSRIEISRHHYAQERNQAIMRFRDQQGVSANEVFTDTISNIIGSLHIKLVCVLQRAGISSPEDIRAYLDFACSLGVKEVVFREFSKTYDLYRENSTLKAIESGRVEIRNLLLELEHNSPVAKELQPISGELGYYYWNMRFQWKRMLDVIFESSDYRIMKSRHKSETIYKLVYHANGNLTADWDPENRVLLRTET